MYIYVHVWEWPPVYSDHQVVLIYCCIKHFYDSSNIQQLIYDRCIASVVVVSWQKLHYVGGDTTLTMTFWTVSGL